MKDLILEYMIEHVSKSPFPSYPVGKKCKLNKKQKDIAQHCKHYTGNAL